MDLETYVQSYNLENPKFQCINKEHWNKLVISNTHSYAKAILIFANELAYSLEQLIKDEEFTITIKQLDHCGRDEEFTITIKQLDHCGRDIESSLGGITGFMYSYAIRILKDTWKYGKELVALHNSKYKVVNENPVNVSIIHELTRHKGVNND